MATPIGLAGPGLAPRIRLSRSPAQSPARLRQAGFGAGSKVGGSACSSRHQSGIAAATSSTSGKAGLGPDDARGDGINAWGEVGAGGGGDVSIRRRMGADLGDPEELFVLAEADVPAEYGVAPWTRVQRMRKRLREREAGRRAARVAAGQEVGVLAPPPAPPSASYYFWRSFGMMMLGAFLATTLHAYVDAKRYIAKQRVEATQDETPVLQLSEEAESLEWVNMCIRKVWRVYQRGIEEWIAGILQPVIDRLVDNAPKSIFRRVEIREFTIDHEPPILRNAVRRTSRKDSDLNAMVDVRYTGGARALLQLTLGKSGRIIEVPIQISDFDVDAKMWMKIRLGPITPYIGTLSFAFVGAPSVRIQLSPFNRLRLMSVPIVSNYLQQLLTVDLPALMVLPKRMEISIPPSKMAVVEAAIGRDAVAQALASAIMVSESADPSLVKLFVPKPQDAAGGVTLPDKFSGELQVTLRKARGLPVWGFMGPWGTNPYCNLVLGTQSVKSKPNLDTSRGGGRGCPRWNQEFQFLVQNPIGDQSLDIYVRDNHLTLKPDIGFVSLPIREVAEGRPMCVWLPLQPSASWDGREPLGEWGLGEVLLELTYTPFMDDEDDSGYKAARQHAKQLESDITDVSSAAQVTRNVAKMTAENALLKSVDAVREVRDGARAAARAALDVVKGAGGSSEEDFEVFDDDALNLADGEKKMKIAAAEDVEEGKREKKKKKKRKSKKKKGGGGGDDGSGDGSGLEGWEEAADRVDAAYGDSDGSSPPSAAPEGRAAGGGAEGHHAGGAQVDVSQFLDGLPDTIDLSAPAEGGGDGGGSGPAKAEAKDGEDPASPPPPGAEVEGVGVDVDVTGADERELLSRAFAMPSPPGFDGHPEAHHGAKEGQVHAFPSYLGDEARGGQDGVPPPEGLGAAARKAGGAGTSMGEREQLRRDTLLLVAGALALIGLLLAH